MTAANRPGKPAAGHDELSAIATGAMLCWLTGDTYAVGRINDEIEKLGVTPEQVATTFGVMAGKMLVEAAQGRTRSLSPTVCLARSARVRPDGRWAWIRPPRS